MDWLEHGLCKGKHTDLWFPPLFKEDRSAPESHYYELAKMVCEHCPVQRQCAELGAEEEYGVWGGTAPNDRKHGTVVPSKRKLAVNYLSKIPQHSHTPLDIPTLKLSLKPYTEKR